jgi:hypothetical protein
MPESIEMTSMSAKRVSTGSTFSMDITPPEFSAYDYWYEHPQLNLKVGFHAKWIYEKRAFGDGDKSIEHSVGLGMILVKDQLDRNIARSLEKLETKPDTRDLVLDCYELIISFLRNLNERVSFPDQPHIYV